jgi:TetR/AcrR family transcriptional repressor of nem operon
MRYDSEHKQRTRERVLTEAAKAIRAEGPHRIGVAGIMAKAGLTHGGFYAHFASKDELVLAALERMFDDARGRVERTTDGKPAAEGLSAYVDWYLSPAHRDARGAGCPMPALAADLPRLELDARTAFGERVASLTARLSAMLAELGREDPEEDAASMIAEMVGALSLARAEPDEVRSEAILSRSRRSVKRRLGLEARP